MLDFSWSELMVVIIVAVIAIGPKQLPEVLYGLGRIFRRLQYMRYALTRQFDDFMDQSELRRMNDPLPPQPRSVDPDQINAEADADEMMATSLPQHDKKQIGPGHE